MMVKYNDNLKGQITDWEKIFATYASAKKENIHNIQRVPTNQ